MQDVFEGQIGDEFEVQAGGVEAVRCRREAVEELVESYNFV